ncbi:hypothetical protein M595_3380 [Lyngbya aestuarii BL J]|uniref:Uncharacterized protein n=1 Tax=Lyngbya aestuarii BL J TaxID=1348334 RepID=U7QJM5_9CYAN|nr:hypothetical protein M595_3380 [Lyngbya aestuarii BL J]
MQNFRQITEDQRKNFLGFKIFLISEADFNDPLSDLSVF